MRMKKLAKKRGFRSTALLLALLMLFAVPGADRCLLPDAAAAGDPVPYLRVGLRYGSTVTASANLLNHRGSGYDIGYFDDSRYFVSLMKTDLTGISVLKDWTMHWAKSSEQYETGANGDIVVGSWHILLDVCNTLPSAQKLASGYADGFVAMMQGEWCACAGSYISKADAEEAIWERGIDGTAMTGSNRCVTVVDTNTGRILFEFDENDRSLGIMPCASGGEPAVTWFSGYRYYGGFQFFRADGNDMTVVNFVNMDDYTACVVDAELGSGWPMEALKAQAVACGAMQCRP